MEKKQSTEESESFDFLKRKSMFEQPNKENITPKRSKISDSSLQKTQDKKRIKPPIPKKPDLKVKSIATKFSEAEKEKEPIVQQQTSTSSDIIKKNNEEREKLLLNIEKIFTKFETDIFENEDIMNEQMELIEGLFHTLDNYELTE